MIRTPCLNKDDCIVLYCIGQSRTHSLLTSLSMRSKRSQKALGTRLGTSGAGMRGGSAQFECFGGEAMADTFELFSLCRSTVWQSRLLTIQTLQQGFFPRSVAGFLGKIPTRKVCRYYRICWHASEITISRFVVLFHGTSLFFQRKFLSTFSMLCEWWEGVYLICLKCF